MLPDQSESRLFAIVPAAGRSRRMGQPKLLLALGTGTVISQMLSSFKRPEIAATIVVVRPDDEPLRAAVAECGAIPLQPDVPPPEMRASVEEALRYLEQRFHARPDDGWLLAPADHPLLDRAVIDRLIAVWRQFPGKMLVPVCRGKRGHPTLFPFRLAPEVFQLPPDQGLNRLLRLRAGEIEEIEVDSTSVISDLDTPEDYAGLQQEWEGRSGFRA
jgi:molybdenum cofactor cytidylyltransferase